jgi:hypothetical protein
VCTDASGAERRERGTRAGVEIGGGGRWCSRVTDDGVAALGRDCAELEAVDLSFCFRVTDRGVLALAAGCAGLEHLRLESCDAVSEAALVAAAQTATRLKSLSLAGCIRPCPLPPLSPLPRPRLRPKAARTCT